MLDNIKSKSFLPNITNDVRQNVTKQIDELLKNKIESISNSTKTTYNLSADDMNQTIQLIEEVNDSSEQKIEALINTYNIASNSLEQIKVGLDSAPREDEFGPIFSKLTQTTRELGELQNELEHWRTLESQEKSLVILVNAKIRANLKKIGRASCRERV